MSDQQPRFNARGWWGLVTDSGLPDAHFIREAAIIQLAQDCLLGHDSRSADNALIWSRHFMDVYEYEEHDGDCTGQPMTCGRCMCDDAKAEMEAGHDE